jgi:hypothetical protein
MIDADTVACKLLRPMVAGVDFALFLRHGLARYADEAYPSVLHREAFEAEINRSRCPPF